MPNKKYCDNKLLSISIGADIRQSDFFSTKMSKKDILSLCILNQSPCFPVSKILIYPLKSFIDYLMFIGTHAMLPVVISTAGDMTAAALYKKRLFSVSDRLAFAFCGVLPDILHPHIGLGSRLTSFSHTLWFALLALPIIIILSYLWHRSLIRFGMICWLAILLHLFCDMISGGIAPLYPMLSMKIGIYYISPKWWIPLDIIIISLFLAELVCLRLIETRTSS